MRITTLFMLFALLSNCLLATGEAAKPQDQSDKPVQKDAPLIVAFKSNEAKLDYDAKAELHHALDGYWPETGEKILVVGYTDTVGDSQKNNRLSLKRAQAVRTELIAVLGLPPASVVALGRGEQHPVASNKDAQGRSLNRRVEIYFAQIVNSHVMDRVRNRKPTVSNLESLIEEARQLVRMRRLAAAFQILARAKAQGGDQSSNWHAVYGIAGYYAGMPAEKIRANLNLALGEDPYNADARAFLGRLEARKKVAQGQIPPSVGMAPDTAVVVSHVEEIYEYLRLLKIQPRTRTLLYHDSMEVWSGEDESGNLVSYYFDHSHVLDWAFDLENASEPTARTVPTAIHSTAALPPKAIPAPAEEPKRTAQTIAGRIWESEIFR